ncbi:MAG: DegV family protein [Armatimonadota bacterium]|nr:DegV family protein [Armatimonadota bacterium]
MGAVLVVTESACSLPLTLCAELGILVVPMWIVRAERSYRDGVDVTLQEVLTWLEHGPPYPTSSAPSPADYLSTFEEAVRRDAGQILVLTVARWLSAAHEHARRAADRFPVPVEVVDTGTAAAAQGLVVREAARRLQAGWAVGEVVEWVKAAGPRARLVAVVRSLDHLHRSGRVPGIAYLLNRRAGAVPLFAIGGGRIRRAGLAANLAAAVRRMVAEVHRAGSRATRLHLAVTEAGMPEEAQHLAGALRSEGADPVPVFPFTPVMAVNTGPGVLGVAYLPEP